MFIKTLENSLTQSLLDGLSVFFCVIAVLFCIIYTH